jgi:hypothetical protein
MKRYIVRIVECSISNDGVFSLVHCVDVLLHLVVLHR